MNEETLKNMTTLELKVAKDFKLEEFPLIDFKDTCSNCKFNDGMVYTSYPPKYKCTFNNEFYAGNHECHLDLAPVTRCEKCEWFLSVEEGRKDEEYKDMPWGFCISAGYNGLCTSIEKWRHNNDFCSEGTIK